jgi:predicted MFS family arabinose efflux permease
MVDPTTTRMHVVPLRRNRDFMLLQSGQLLSAAGSEATAIAYPLLVLALTQSPAKAGAVAAAQVIPFALFGVLAGVAADRFDRRRVMLLADAVRAAAIATLAATILLDRVAFWAIMVVAFVEGSGSAFFRPAAAGALRSVVSTAQLPAAANVQQGRIAAVVVAGPPVGGALFGIGRAVPFVFDTASYLCSVVSLLFMRTPFQSVRERDRSPLRQRIAEGFRFLWDEPFLRTTTFLYGLANFIGPGLLLTIVVLGERQGLSGGQIGILLAVSGLGIFCGSLVAPFVRRVLSIRAIMMLELWLWTGPLLFLLHPDVYVLVAAMLPASLAIPSTDSVVIGYRLAITPDRLVGRVESVRSSIALLVAPLGPLVAGVLLGATSARATVAVFAAFGLVLAVWATLSPAIRAAPRLDEIA